VRIGISTKGIEHRRPALAEIINLRQARKRKLKAEKDTQAETNRSLYGRTKSEKKRTAAERLQAQRELDGHKRED
jgi:hypothetical protein